MIGPAISKCGRRDDLQAAWSGVDFGSKKSKFKVKDKKVSECLSFHRRHQNVSEGLSFPPMLPLSIDVHQMAQPHAAAHAPRFLS